MSYVRGSCGRKTPYEKKFSRKGKEQEEWALEKAAMDSRAEQVSDIDGILEQFEARSEEGRKCALRNLIRSARNFEYKEGDLEKNEKLLVQFILPSIHGSPEEAVLAFDAIEILAAVFGDDPDFLSAVLDPVRSMALTAAPQKLEDEEQAVIGTAMRTLGVLCFFCCDDDDEIVKIVHSIDSVVSVEPKNVSQPVVAAALGAWELIHTTTKFSDEYHDRMVKCIFKHLKSNKSSCDTRIAAARALALSFYRIADPGDTIDKLSESIPQIDLATDVIHECAYGTNHPKHDRAKEQPIFKMLDEWMVEGGDLPEETVTLNDSKVVFETWPILARLATVRRIVGSGFLPHLINNQLIAEVLQFEVPEKERRRRTTEAQKKYKRYLAKLDDKERTTRLAKARSTSSNYDEE